MGTEIFLGIDGFVDFLTGLPEGGFGKKSENEDEQREERKKEEEVEKLSQERRISEGG